MSGPEQTVRIPAGLRWRCQGTGACCRFGYALGPVEDGVIAGLSAAGIEGLWAPAAAGWYERRSGPDGRVAHFLTTRDGACVFLRDDDRCAVHALLGEQAKPWFCREFPYSVTSDPRGLVAVVRPVCAGFGAASASAERADGLESAVELVRARPREHFAPPRVTVVEEVPGRVAGTVVDLATWMDWEVDLLAALEGPDQPEALVARARAHLEARTGSPATRGAPRGATSASPTADLRADDPGRALLRVLLRVLEGARASAGGEPHQVRFVEASIEQLSRALAREGPAPPLDEASQAFCSVVLRSHLLAKEFAAWGGVGGGLGLVLLGLQVARDGGGVGPAPLGVAELGARHAGWSKLRALTPVSRVLGRARLILQELYLSAAR